MARNENAQSAMGVRVKGDDDWDFIAASATGFTLGAGATGGYLSHLVIIPLTTSPGEVDLLDGSASNIIFKGGASSVTSLCPFVIPVNAYSRNGAWKITTSTNVNVLAVGRFG